MPGHTGIHNQAFLAGQGPEVSINPLVDARDGFCDAAELQRGQLH